MTRFLALAACAILGMLASANAESWAEERKATTTYVVPTSGEIMDVIYLPEFDEWWVKCKEGKGVSVYSYDKRSKKWGHALFVPRKVLEKPKNGTRPGGSEKPVQKEKSGTAPQTEIQPPGKPKEKQVTPDAGSVNSSPKREAGNTKSEKKKWWDPLQLLKGDKKTLSPRDEALP